MMPLLIIRLVAFICNGLMSVFSLAQQGQFDSN